MPHSVLESAPRCAKYLAMVAALSLAGCTAAHQGSDPVDTTIEEVVSEDVSALEIEALSKIEALEILMAQSRAEGVDVVREQTAAWFAKEFIKFSNWDEANPAATEYIFAQYAPYQENAAEYAANLPDFQRGKVIEIVDEAIATLSKVRSGEITRRPVNPVDWENIIVADDMLMSNGRPVFLYDYFSKTVGRPLTDENIYNDHLGAIYHGGQRLYDVNKDRAVNSYLLNVDGTFDQERLSYITEIPDTNVGFLILWNMGIPDWVLEQEPEAALGRSLFTGFDIDNPLVREVWGKIIRKAGELTKGKKVTQLGYILSNEPHWYSVAGHWTQNFKEMTSISSYTMAKFRGWLAETYQGDLAALNTNWGSAFNSFETVEIEIPMDPALRETPFWYDWSRFNMYRAVDWFTYLQGELREVDPDVDTHLKIMPNMFTDNRRSHGIDLEALTNLTSMIGDDAKAKTSRDPRRTEPEPWEARYAYFWEEMSVAYDFMESVSPGKIHINSESHFLSASWYRELDANADYVRSVHWLATIQGMDAAISWFWARDPDGSPEDRLEGELDFFDPALAGSYAASVNMQPHIANAKTQVFLDMNSFAEEIMAIRHQRRPVRLFHSETSAINKSRHMSEQFEMYEALYFEGFPVGYATEKVLRNQDHSNWDTVLVYKTEFVTDAEFAALQAYLDAGGTVIVDSASSLSKNEYGIVREAVLTDGAGILTMLTEETSVEGLRDVALEAVRSGLAPIELTEENGTAHKGSVWRVVETEAGYLVNILNIGKNKAALNLSSKTGDDLVIVNMMTGEAVEPDIELDPFGVLLLEVKTAP